MSEEIRPNDGLNNQPKEGKDNEIPLWLQGIEGNEVEETKQTMPAENDPTDHWVKEIAEDLLLEEEGSSVQDDILHQSDLPEWIDHLPNDSVYSQDIPPLSDEKSGLDINGFQEGNQDTENSVGDQNSHITDPKANGFSEIIDTSPRQLPDNGGYVEISSLNDFDEQHLSDVEENLSVDEELPVWLQEMINEPDPALSAEVDEDLIEPASAKDEEKDILFDEPTQPVSVITDALLPEDSLDIQHAVQDWAIEVEQEHTQQDQLEEQPGQPEQKTTSEDLVESIPLPEPDLERSCCEELPGDLINAKSLLEKGLFSEAVNIFMNHTGNPGFNNQIQAWLQDSIERQGQANSDIWEFLGDLRLENDNPDGAFAAYTDAINQLIHRKRKDHETD